MILSSKHKLLRSVSAEVTDFSDVPQIIDEIRKNMKPELKCSGMAACQVGILKKVAICKLGKKEYIIVNPKVIHTIGYRNSNEGCLSVNGRFIVKRPLLAKVEWQTETGKVMKKVLTYKKARVFLHEYEHLEGVCIDSVGTPWAYTHLASKFVSKEEAERMRLV